MGHDPQRRFYALKAEQLAHLPGRDTNQPVRKHGEQWETIYEAGSGAAPGSAASPPAPGITSFPGRKPLIEPPIEKRSPISALRTQPTLQCVEEGIQLGLLREDVGRDADALVLLPVADAD